MLPGRSLIGILLLLPSLCAAQLSQGGTPPTWTDAQLIRSVLPVVALDPPAASEGAVGLGSADFRYGFQRPLHVDVLEVGVWHILSDGRISCQLVLHSPGAVMMSVQFADWDLPVGGEVFLYDPARTDLLGAFTAANASQEGTMATALLPGDSLVIEYVFPGAALTGALRVGSITHATLDPFARPTEAAERDYNPGYQSSPCQINVACPEAAPWQQQKRAVAMFLRPDGGGCTGTLLNNTATPGRPYFHIANHCYTPTTADWVFYFNYEAPGCVGSVGSTDQTLTGAVLRAAHYFDDLCLLELNNAPPPSFNPFYAGWDRTGAVPQSSVVIQHPMYDVKKIAFNNDPSTSFTDAIGVQCWRGNWDQGLVQAVSSGSPLFDQNGRMVGHMYDGAQVCSTATTIATDCAKFSASWDGTSASTRLRDWLDPSNTVSQLDGFEPFQTPADLQLRLKVFLDGPYNADMDRMGTALTTNGLVPTTEPYTSLGYVHVAGGGGESTTPAVLGTVGANAVVDWVVVELRDRNDPQVVRATRSALLQADGDVVGVNGTAPISFNQPVDQYFVAVRHRNHLGIMTAGQVALSNEITVLDLTNGAVALFGGAEATKAFDGKQLMYAGDCTADGVLRYTGPNNDRDAILTRVGGTVPTNVVLGYFVEDTNLDGIVRYTGTANDRDIILQNLGGTVPTNTRSAQLP